MKISEEMRPSEKYAVEELKTWTAKLGVGDVNAEIIRDDSLGEDGFRLHVENGKLTVSGGRRGVLYGVYEALERFGGIKWLSLNTTVVPEKGGFVLPESFDEVQKPAFEMRQPLWYDVEHDSDLAARLKLNSHQLEERHGGCTHLFDTKLRNCHTFFHSLISPEEYFDAHPEYFSYFKGKRQKDHSQLCLSNPDVFQIVLKKVLERIEANPGAKYFGISQEDWGGYCECEKCAAIDAEEESHAGQVIRFVNAIAAEVEKKYPDKVIETLAYQWSRKPPKKTRVRHNVMPCLCSIECEFRNPLEKSEYAANKSFLDDLRGWAAQTDQLYVWDYTTDFSDYLYPFPNFNVLQDNLRTFRNNNVKSIFEQGAYQGRHADFAELKTYMLSKWMWNPETEMDNLLDDFFPGYYGKAAPLVRKYFDELRTLPRDPKLPMSIYESAYSTQLPDEFLERAAKMWDEAETLVKNDPRTSYNVRMGRLTVDTTRLLRHRDAPRRWCEWQSLARKVLAAFAEGKDIRFSETQAYNDELLADLKRYAELSYTEAAAVDTLSTRGRTPIIAIDRFIFEPGRFYTLQVHVKGGGFEAGVDKWDTIYNCGRRHLASEFVGVDFEWHDILTWHTAPGEYFWFKPTDPSTEIDSVRLVNSGIACIEK